MIGISVGRWRTQSFFPEYEARKEHEADWPVVGGILMILGGFVPFALVAWIYLDIGAEPSNPNFMTFVAMTPLGIISIIGGIAAVRRRSYSLAFAGGVCSVLCSSIIGLAGLILVVKSKAEFQNSEPKRGEPSSSVRKRP
jgi:UDP-N-acetylmuramyl pentapeptide phosphotransferase/UDP-N-acetylglucosamine-1-phosphate transferase